MALTYTDGDPFLTAQQTLALGVSASSRTETTPLIDALAQRYPAALSGYRKSVQQGRLAPGDVWTWTMSIPRLALLVVRETPNGPTRPRFVDAVAHRLARDHALEGILSLAIAPLGRPTETASIHEALALTLGASPLTVIVYTRYLPGIHGEPR